VKRSASLLVLLLLFSLVLFSFLQIDVVKAEEGTIYIRADGTVEGTDKISRDGNLYTFLGNISIDGSGIDGIIVERDNIVIDGAGYTLQGKRNGTDVGISLPSIINVTIKSIEIKNFSWGISLYNSLRNSISGNTITNNIRGINFWADSNYNTISGNNITANEEGMFIYGSSNNITGNTITENSGHAVDFYGSSNIITGNCIVKNGVGVYINGNIPFAGSQNNSIYHNSFINNTKQVSDILWGVSFSAVISVNIWDDGYPSGGNYWSDHKDTDMDGDAIGDTPYVIDENNTDNYPLMAPIKFFDAGTWEWTRFNVDIVSNSTVSNFSFNPECALIVFNVEGGTGTSGFCRVTFPKDLLDTENDWTVLIDGNSVTPIVNEDETSTYLYFTYSHSTKTVEIIGTDAIPEFPSWTPLLVTLVAVLAIAVIYRRSLRKQVQRRNEQ
jgi:parallel beta-helix repeat protein